MCMLNMGIELKTNLPLFSLTKISEFDGGMTSMGSSIDFCGKKRWRPCAVCAVVLHSEYKEKKKKKGHAMIQLMP